MTFRSENRSEMWLAVALIACAAAVRLLPHPDNFTPVAAAALFAGFTLPASLAFTVPLLIVTITDFWIGPHALIAFSWAAFALTALLGNRLRGFRGAGPVLAGSLAGSVIFFLVTNFGVFLEGKLYPRTWDGFVECYTLALPFFRNTAIGDVFYAAALFSVFSLARRAVRKRAEA